MSIQSLVKSVLAKGYLSSDQHHRINRALFSANLTPEDRVILEQLTTGLINGTVASEEILQTS